MTVWREERAVFKNEYYMMDGHTFDRLPSQQKTQGKVNVQEVKHGELSLFELKTY